MKKIINGTRYDTEKAVLVGYADNCSRGVDSITDFGYWEAGLYKTPRSNRFFLAGHGGPASRFAQSAGQNSWQGGEDIMPMNREDALTWAERWLSTPETEKHFGDLIEDA